jgi:hypothetical protein
VKTITVCTITASGDPHATVVVGCIDGAIHFTVSDGTPLQRNLARDRRIAFTVSDRDRAVIGRGEAGLVARSLEDPALVARLAGVTDNGTFTPAGWGGSIWHTAVETDLRYLTRSRHRSRGLIGAAPNMPTERRRQGRLHAHRSASIHPTAMSSCRPARRPGPRTPPPFDRSPDSRASWSTRAWRGRITGRRWGARALCERDGGTSPGVLGRALGGRRHYRLMQCLRHWLSRDFRH